MKHCSKCNEDLPLDSFYAHPTTIDGRQKYCKTCQKRTVTEGRIAQRSAAHQAEPEQRRLEHQDRLDEWEASFMREKQEASPDDFQDAFCFIERKPMFTGFVRKQTKQFSWRAA